MARAQHCPTKRVLTLLGPSEEGLQSGSLTESWLKLRQDSSQFNAIACGIMSGTGSTSLAATNRHRWFNHCADSCNPGGTLLTLLSRYLSTHLVQLAVEQSARRQRVPPPNFILQVSI